MTMKKHFYTVILCLLATSCAVSPPPKKILPQEETKFDTKAAADPNRPHPRSDERIQQRLQMVQRIRSYYGLKDEKVLKALENVPRWHSPQKLYHCL